jgi:hypothetical protein
MPSFRVPEIVLGCFLTIAVFAIGMLFEGTKQPSSPTQSVSKQETAAEGQKTQNPDAELIGSTWLTKDAAGFFTFGLVLIGLGQALLFFVQLRYMRNGMEDATRAAKAAEDAAKASTEQAKTAERALTELERPWVFLFGISRPQQDDGGFFVTYTVANYGKMPAIIEYPRISFVFEDTQGNPQTPTLVSDDNSLMTSQILKAGEERVLREYFPANTDGSVRFVIINQDTPEETLHAVPSVDLGAEHIMFFRSIICYRGPNSQGHETGANWLYRDPWDFVIRLDEYNYTK